jgi:hypothetical protein
VIAWTQYDELSNGQIFAQIYDINLNPIFESPFFVYAADNSSVFRPYLRQTNDGFLISLAWTSIYTVFVGSYYNNGTISM